MSVVVYGVVRSRLGGISAAGVAGAIARLVAVDDLAAVVSDAPDEVLARRRDVAAHMDVLDEVMRGGVVLPFRFGTLADDEDAVRRMLADRHDDFAQQLDELDGTVQVTVRVTHDVDAAVRDVVAADPRLRRFVERSRRRAGFDAQFELGEQIAAAVAVQAEADQAQVVDAVAPLVVAMAPRDDASAVVSLALLLPRDRLDEVDEAVADVASRLGGRCRVELAGPMPAFSFVG